jgi:hypothetical protein
VAFTNQLHPFASLDVPPRCSHAVIVDKTATCLHRTAQYVARPRRTASPSAAWAGGRTSSSTIRLIAMVALGIRGLIEVVESLPLPWAQLVVTLVLALEALAFVAMAARSRARRFAWLLSASAAAGLAIAAGYRFASTGPLAVIVLLALSLIAAYGARRALRVIRSRRR